MPTLLMVGSIVGTLDGVATYTLDELADDEILNEIHGPMPEDPYRFLGLRWIVKGHSSAVPKFIWPRDLVFFEATGLHQGRHGERIGYHLMHSLDLPGYGPLQG